MSEHNIHFHEWFYTPSVNEEGWGCIHCDEKPGEPPGFSPQLDKEEIENKVASLVDELTNANLLYLSNNSEADNLVFSVANYCRIKRKYDQYSIIEYIFNLKRSHGEYWKKISQGILKGKDPRERCACGQLATIHIFSDKKTSSFCMKCRELANVAETARQG